MSSSKVGIQVGPTQRSRRADSSHRWRRVTKRQVGLT